MSLILRASCVTLIGGSLGWVAAAATLPPPAGSVSSENPPQTVTRQELPANLAAWQPMIGQWKGVGQPKRGSTAGTWREELLAAWDFSAVPPALVWHIPAGKFWQEVRFSADTQTNTLLATSTVSSQDNTASTQWVVSIGENLSFQITRAPAENAESEADAPAASLPESSTAEPAGSAPAVQPLDAVAQVTRIQGRMVAGGDRLVLLFERTAADGSFARVAEIGYTRLGSGFGKGATGPECIVTGGLGTIEVSHEGKNYFVCCEGCRQLFVDDPEGVIADYKERKAAKPGQ